MISSRGSCGLQGFAPPPCPYLLMGVNHQQADTPMAFRSSRADHHLSVWFVWCRCTSSPFGNSATSPQISLMLLRATTPASSPFPDTTGSLAVTAHTSPGLLHSCPLSHATHPEVCLVTDRLLHQASSLQHPSPINFRALRIRQPGLLTFTRWPTLMDFSTLPVHHPDQLPSL